MSDTPTPAPALTGEQIDYFTGIIRECAADAEVIMPSADVVDRWLAAVIDRAKREEREQLRDRVAAQMPEHGRHINMTAYREGLIDGVNRALRVLEATDDETR